MWAGTSPTTRRRRTKRRDRPELAQTLMRHGLIDVYRILVFPVWVGPGKRLVGDGALPASLRLE